MIVSTTKEYRKSRLEQLSPSKFDSYRDFFFALHLNTRTQQMHLIGALIGPVFFVWALITLNIWIFLINLFFFYGFGFFSHWIFDGVVSRTAKEAPWGSFRFALEINWLCLIGKMGETEEKFLQKYPFVREIYLKE